MTARVLPDRHRALRAALAAAADRLTDRVLAEMYADPFWAARFGERARTHGRADGLHHLAYLGEALALADAGVMTRYARWLQQVLTTRGMCTRHLADNFARLARAIDDEGWPDGPAAVALLEAAIDALAYPPGPARAVQDAATTLADAIVLGTCAPAAEADALVSYLADALALGGPATLVAHVRWRAAALPPAGASPAALAAQLAALAATLTDLPAAHVEAARAALA